MNPSAVGWIKKTLKTLERKHNSGGSSLADFYPKLRSCGFIYGSNMEVVDQLIEDKDFTNEERCKLNLFFALKVAHCEYSSQQNFSESVVEFYKEINEYKTSIFSDIIGSKDSFKTLEDILQKRIQIDDNIISKSFNYFITNALLFIDVLAYQHYIMNKTITEHYIKQLETSIETIVINTLDSKERKTEYDESLIKLFESSLRYQDHASMSYDEAIQLVGNHLEAQYLFDISCMSTWSDQQIDVTEQYFLEQLGLDLGLTTTELNCSIDVVNKFYTKHKDSIALLNSKNVVKTFYDNSSKMVSKLLKRNSKRLQKELIESKELMKLLTQSTIRDLSEEEQKKVQGQLIDIFKSIPSLAIFMLPGGMLLLPLVVKFIPKLLPSAFDENRIEEE